MATLQERIDNLERILDSGARSATGDGRTTVFDLDSVRRQLARLKAQQDAATRPRNATVDLSGY